MLLCAYFSNAQKIEGYYDYKWEPCLPSEANYYSIIEKKENLWERLDYFVHEKKLQMKGTYKDSSTKMEQGPLVYYHSNGFLESEGDFEEGKRNGRWLRY